jgi:hypothetical protein
MATEETSNNPETGTANSFRNGAATGRPEEAGDTGAGMTDKKDLGKESKMDKTSLREEEGYKTMDEDEGEAGHSYTH